MDSMDLEREKGITIKAKNASIALGRLHDQHRGHPGPRGFRRRGGAHPEDGGRRAAAGGRRGGPAGPDPLRAAQGARSRPEAVRGHQQDRPRARRPPPGARPGAGAAAGTARQRGAVPRAVPLRQRPRRLCGAGPGGPAEGHDAAVRDHRRTTSRRRRPTRRAVPDAGQQPRLERLRRPDRHRQGHRRARRSWAIRSSAFTRTGARARRPITQGVRVQRHEDLGVRRRRGRQHRRHRRASRTLHIGETLCDSRRAGARSVHRSSIRRRSRCSSASTTARWPGATAST